MKRHLLALLGLFFVLSGTVSAETIPANPYQSIALQVLYTVNSTTYYYAASTACTTGATAVGKTGTYTSNGATLPNYPQSGIGVGTCVFSPNGSTYNATAIVQCPATYSWNGSECRKGGYSCPENQGWTLSGSTCTRPDCDVGFDRDSSGQCVKDCTGKAGQPTTNGSYSFSGAVSTWAVSQCRVRCAVRVISAYGGTGEECKYTGASANPEDPSAEPLPPDPERLPPENPNDCISRGEGYIQTSSGTKCVPSQDAPEGQKPDKVESDTNKESGKPGPDGKPDKEAPDYHGEETTTTRNPDGTTSTTSKETVNGTPDGNGGVTCPEGYTKEGTKCTKTTSTSQNTSQFCAEHPHDPTCKGTTKDECQEYPDRVGCTEMGEAPQVPGLSENAEGMGSILAVNVASNASCPADIQLPKGMSFSFTPFCDYASAFRPIILVLAWITAGFLVFGYRGNN